MIEDKNTLESVSEKSTVVSGSKVCSVFFPRLLAFLCDFAIVHILVIAIPVFVGDPLYELGNWMIVVVLMIYIIYFGVQNSSICGGQTIVKRLAKIKVVDSNGSTISPVKSILRSTFLFTPIICYQSLLPMMNSLFSFQERWSSLFFILMCLFSAMIFMTLYLFLFNRRNRATLHDIVFGTLVVWQDTKSLSKVEPIWLGNYLICVILSTCFVCSRVISYNDLKDSISDTLAKIARNEVEQIVEKENFTRSARLWYDYDLDDKGVVLYINLNITRNGIDASSELNDVLDTVKKIIAYYGLTDYKVFAKKYSLDIGNFVKHNNRFFGDMKPEDFIKLTGNMTEKVVVTANVYSGFSLGMGIQQGRGISYQYSVSDWMNDDIVKSGTPIVVSKSVTRDELTGSEVKKKEIEEKKSKTN